jgi:hypothetical protein
MQKIFHEFHIPLPVHLMVNSGKDALAAYTLTLQGRQELRELERGYSTPGAVANSLIDLKFFVKGDVDFDRAIDHACELAGNSGALLMSEESPEPDSASPIPIDE